MTVKQKRAFAYALACCAIFASLILWAEVVRSHLVGNVMPDVPLAENVPLTAEEEEVPVQPIASSATENSPRKAPLLPSLHFAASSLSRSDSESSSPMREELKQWELTESYALSIPTLSVRAPVYLPSMRYWTDRSWDLLERQMQVGLLSGLVSYPHSVAPGAVGTIIIAGHSSPPSDRAKESHFGEVFARLPKLALYDQIVLRTGAATVTYEVIDTKIVPAGDTGILTQQKEETLLKLITCYPIGSVKERYVVIARKV